ncbi:Adenylosuccinate synthetase isozyme 2-like [Oopsacas minuta]|uniref:Adenylosuccinate synthetase n=1 Tax=Oopsacas minuta TaxID=111878 RepID=A0AAV7K6S9_9METZ|nr:Adenylosuccinate synthetase isozyme 2-like [Oopsacas minuta]
MASEIVAQKGEVSLVFGGQWGDEGKGKLVDLLCGNSDLVCRCQGGNNAGHTVVAGGIAYDFHLLPSGIIHEKCVSVIGNGVVIHLPGLFSEIEKNEGKGLVGWQKRLKISDRAHIVLDVHQEVDALLEEEKGSASLGTTRKGIGVTYADKSLRVGLRVADLFSEDHILEQKINQIFTGYSKRFPQLKLDVISEVNKLKSYATRLRPLVCDTISYVNKRISEGSRVLVEGANAAMLDIDFGTYPYVTSSNCTTGAACTGLGISPKKLDNIYGAFKAYTTRVGSGHFPTELTGEIEDKLQTIGKEFGVTTGRRRRCGWFDAVVARYSHMLNGYTGIAILKLDVLDSFDEIKIGVKYMIDGEVIESFPSTMEKVEKVIVEYVTYPGWNCDITGVRKFEDLPENAQKYVRGIELYTGIKIRWIGVGSAREAMITIS